MEAELFLLCDTVVLVIQQHLSVFGANFSSVVQLMACKPDAMLTILAAAAKCCWTHIQTATFSL